MPVVATLRVRLYLCFFCSFLPPSSPSFSPPNLLTVLYFQVGTGFKGNTALKSYIEDAVARGVIQESGGVMCPVREIHIPRGTSSLLPFSAS